MYLRHALYSAALLCVAMPQARADALVTERQIPFAVALAGATAAIESCSSQGYRIAVTVVDRSGNPRVTLRADGANPHLLEGAARKAYTSAMIRISTVQMGQIVERSPGAAGLMSFEHMTALGGGLPIKMGDEVIGGIGVAGVPVGGAGRCRGRGLRPRRARPHHGRDRTPLTEGHHSSRLSGSSITRLNSAIHSAASAPSTTRWSTLRVHVMTVATASAPAFTTGF